MLIRHYVRGGVGIDDETVPAWACGSREGVAGTGGWDGYERFRVDGCDHGMIGQEVDDDRMWKEQIDVEWDMEFELGG